MTFNGLMIDASRLLEPKPYYYRLVEFMAQWKLKTLLFHFSDDFGCAIRLAGFEHLAMPGAFTPAELRRFIAFATSRGIEVIPELETFGHTLYLTDHPRYRHLFAGKRTKALHFNAIDPLSAETHDLMRRLITAVAKAFPSRYFHLGCDEVDLTEYCRQDKLDVASVWTDYVNRMIHLAREAGKTPMIWADHVTGNPAIARLLRKDVILVDWRYTDDIKDGVITGLRRAGFKDIAVAPSLACAQHRFHPTRQALENTDRMARFACRHKAMGVINTIWCPWRYLQNTLYYGIAYSAYSVQQRGTPDRTAFNRIFARRLFDTPLTPSLKRFLEAWSALHLYFELWTKIIRHRTDMTPRDLKLLKALGRNGLQALSAAAAYTPRTHPEIWNAMVLSAKAAWLCGEGTLLRLDPAASASRKSRYNRLLTATRREMDQEWDRTRDPADPQKYRTRFPKHDDNYALLLVRSLKQAS